MISRKTELIAISRINGAEHYCRKEKRVVYTKKRDGSMYVRDSWGKRDVVVRPDGNMVYYTDAWTIRKVVF